MRGFYGRSAALDTAAVISAARLIASADALLVTVGAGMGVDSGLPDFRGREGFWRAYPALARAGIAFEEAACPDTFRRDPQLAWGFYGHRLALYRSTVPHPGFALLRRWGERLPDGLFVLTSNVDGQFAKAGFSAREVCEIHGSIHHLQCLEPCCERIWSASALEPQVDEAECRWLGELPRCPRCGGLARPNILMFGDGAWLAARTRQQQVELDAWRHRAGRTVVLEIGAGTQVATLRCIGERLGLPLIRVNPGEAEMGNTPGVGIAAGAREALEALDAIL